MVRAVATALKDIVVYFELSATDLVSDDWVEQIFGILIFVCGQRQRNYLNCCCSCSPFGLFPHEKEFK